MSLKDIVKTVAPIIGTALGSPIVGGALGFLGQWLLGDDKASEETVRDTISKLAQNPEGIEKLKGLDPSFFSYLSTEANAAVEAKRIAADNTKNARDLLSKDKDNERFKKMLNFGIFIIVLSMLALVGLAIGIYYLITKELKILEPSIIALVFGLVGGLITHLMNNIGTIINYFFGSSEGSAEKSRLLAMK